MGMDPTSDQLACALGMSAKKLNALVQSSFDHLSLDMVVGEGYGTTLGGLIRDERADDPEESVVTSELIEELTEIICELNDREQKVMRLRFRMDGTPFGIEEQQLADELNISRERVRQIEIQAIKKLRMLASRRRMNESLLDGL
jgi:RNA polymerase primary sigma factor